MDEILVSLRLGEPYARLFGSPAALVVDGKLVAWRPILMAPILMGSILRGDPSFDGPHLSISLPFSERVPGSVVE